MFRKDVTDILVNRELARLKSVQEMTTRSLQQANKRLAARITFHNRVSLHASSVADNIRLDHVLEELSERGL